jgi:hypothetical protein
MGTEAPKTTDSNRIDTHDREGYEGGTKHRHTNIAHSLQHHGLAPASADAANFGVDTTFGPDSGHYRFDRDTSDDWVHDSAVDSQGRILLAFLIEDSGNPGLYYPAVMRLTPDGYGDPSFGFLGLWLESTIDATPEVAINIAVDTQDRPVVGWTYEFDQGTPGNPVINRDWYVRRLTTGGTVDDGHVVAIDLGVSTSGDRLDEMNDIMVLSDDRIVAVGGSQYDGSDWDLAVAVVKDDATLGLTYDTAFHSDGRVTVAYDLSGGSDYDMGQAVIADHTGNLLVTGWSNSSTGNVVTVTRIDKDTGAMDSTFDGDGKATYAYTPLLDPAERSRGIDVSLKTGGLAVAAVLYDGSYEHIGVLGLNTDGSVDMGFGTNGWFYSAPGYPGAFLDPASTRITGIATDYDRLVYSASVEDPLDPNQRMGIVGVLNFNGTPRTEFTTGGYDHYWFEPTGEQIETSFSNVLVPGFFIGTASGKAILTGSMRGITGGGSRTDGDLLATRVATQADTGPLFADGFESGNTGAWSAP